MIHSKKKSRTFNFLLRKDVEAYDEIINNPQCTVLEERTIKETRTEGDGEEAVRVTIDHIFVTYEEREMF